MKCKAKHYLNLLMTVKINYCILRTYWYSYFCCNHMQY